MNKKLLTLGSTTIAATALMLPIASNAMFGGRFLSGFTRINTTGHTPASVLTKLRASSRGGNVTILTSKYTGGKVIHPIIRTGDPSRPFTTYKNPIMPYNTRN